VSRSIVEHFLDYPIISGRFRWSNATVSTVSFFSPILHVNELAYVKASASEGKKKSPSRDEERRVIWYDFYLRLGDLLNHRSKFQSWWFHVRLDTIYARLVFSIREDSAVADVVSPMISAIGCFWIYNILVLTC